MAPPGVVQDVNCRAIFTAQKQLLRNSRESVPQHLAQETEVTESGVPAILWFPFVIAFFSVLWSLGGEA